MGRTGRQGEEGSNKENNPLSVNCLATRRKYALRNQPRPLTSNFEATFNPFPHPNAFSIPLLPARAATIDHSEHTEQQSLAHELCLHIARQQKGPIIARNGKLKSFFHPDTGRYARRESVPDPRTARSLRGCSLDALNTRTTSQDFDMVTLADRRKRLLRRILFRQHSSLPLANGAGTARVMFDLPEGLTEIEIKLADIYAARAIARQLADTTGLEATAWMDKNQRLREALEGQGSSGSIIKMFTLITIVVGVASALLLTTYRRRPEIGIMRSFGISQRFVLSVFMLQGALIGVLGSIIGCALGYSFCLVLTRVTSGRLPVDASLGQYDIALLLAAAASILAALWPARAASRIDPVEAISQ